MLRTPTTPSTGLPKAPTSKVDPYADEALSNPWPPYRKLREMGLAVWLEKYGQDCPKIVSLAFARVMDRPAFRLERNGCLFH
jgi:hypothetical protein